jgi:hypothetical protein
MYAFVLPVDAERTERGTNQRVCLDTRRTRWYVNVPRAEVAASLLYSWLGDEVCMHPQVGKGVARCMRTAPPARLKHISVVAMH